MLPSGAGIDLHPVLLLFFAVSIATVFLALCIRISDRFDNEWRYFYNLLGLIGFAVIIAITLDVVFGIKLSELWRQISLRFL
jgi:hypothetical protein